MGVIRGCIYSDPNTLAAEYRGEGMLPCPKQLHPLQSRQQSNFSQFFPILLNDTPIGTLYIEIGHADLMDRIRQFLIFSVMILAAAVMLSLLLASRLQSMVARPMRDLSNTLRNIMLRKDYSIRAGKDSNDELGDLVDLFNSLLRTIEEENASLKTSKERFHKLTALSPVGIFQLDQNQQLQYVNQRWRDIHGVQSNLPGLQEWFARIHADDLPDVRQAWNRLTSDQESIVIELRLQRRDQSHVWIQLMASALHDRNGELQGYLGVISDISELKAAQLQMETLAFYDPLTGLANRRLFRNRLEKAVKTVMRSGTSMALMFLDMDQFKRVNDTLGHDAGDSLLKEVASRLNNTVRENDDPGVMSKKKVR